MNEQKKDFASMTPAELAVADAEGEAEYEKVVAAAKLPKMRKRARQHIGCPWEFLVAVRRLPHKSTTLLVALLVYRQTKVFRNQAVTLPGPQLAELGIDPRRRREALHNLEAAGIVRLRMGPGQRTEITLLWRPAAP